MPDAVAALVGGLPDQPVVGLVVGVRPVAHVQPGDVHPGVDELADLLAPPATAGPRVQTIFALRT